MVNLNKLYGLPKDSGIAIEDSEDTVCINYNNEIKAVYARPTETTLKRGVENILAKVKEENKEKDLIGKI